jgi:trans-aconitate 2-methyltransferase
MRWNPARYGQYGSERSMPFFDLVGHVDAEHPRRVVDLGCGPGALTQSLAERWPDAEVVGIDSSAEMLEAAEELSDRPANLRFEHADIHDWQPGPHDDVVVTNAALQWVPDHRELLPGWLDALPRGATFAMQVPGNFRSPSHTILKEVADDPRWRDAVRPVIRDDDIVAEPGAYLQLMLEHCGRAIAWETSYQHLLPGDDPVLDWVRGTWLRPILGALDEERAAAFEAEAAPRLRAAYPRGRFGTVFPFRRIFAVGVK